MRLPTGRHSRSHLSIKQYISSTHYKRFPMPTTPICPVCGTELQPGVTTCPVCGCDIPSGDNDALVGLIQSYIDKGQYLLALKLLNDSGLTGGEYDRLRAQLQSANNTATTPPPPPAPAVANQTVTTSTTQTETNEMPVEIEKGFLPQLRIVSLLAVCLVPMILLPLLGQLMPKVFYEVNGSGVPLYNYVQPLFMAPLFFLLAVYALKGRAATTIGWICTALAVGIFLLTLLQVPWQVRSIIEFILYLLMACCARQRYRAPLVVLTVLIVLEIAFYGWGFEALIIDSGIAIPQTSRLFTTIDTLLRALFIFAWAWSIYVSMTESKTLASPSANKAADASDTPAWGKALGIISSIVLLMGWLMVLGLYFTNYYTNNLFPICYVINALGLLLLAGLVVAHALKTDNLVVKATGLAAAALTAVLIIIFVAVSLPKGYNVFFQDFIWCNMVVSFICGAWFWAAKCLSKGAMRGSAAYAVIVLILAISPNVAFTAEKLHLLFYNMGTLLTLESAIIILPIALAFPRLNKIVPALITFGVLLMLLLCYFVGGLFTEISSYWY